MSCLTLGFVISLQTETSWQNSHVDENMATSVLLVINIFPSHTTKTEFDVLKIFLIVNNRLDSAIEWLLIGHKYKPTHKKVSINLQ